MKIKRVVIILLIVIPLLLIGIGIVISGGDLLGMVKVMLWSDPSDNPETNRLFAESKASDRKSHLAEFDLTNLTIDESELLCAADGIDSIMALVMPGKTPVDEQQDFTPDERVIVVEMEEMAVAYPILILNWHEIVNDVILDTPIAVSY